jgi:membrane-bound metal-dependent hydrolase YbcI (DUF457 family)
MSLPVGHGLVGSLVLAAFDRRVRFCPRRMAWLLALVVPSVPDFDFFFVWVLGWPAERWHRTFSHSLTFAVLGGLAAAAIVRLLRRPGPLTAAAYVGALLLSHCFVDMAGYGPHAPGNGVMLFWPFSRHFWSFPFQFLPPGSHAHPIWYLRTALLELVLLGPPVAAVWAAKRWWERRVSVGDGRDPAA